MRKIMLGIVLLVTLVISLSDCGGGGGGGGAGSGTCDIVANPSAACFLKVTNSLSTDAEWTLSAYAFGAYMRSGECTLFGLSPGTYDVELRRCSTVTSNPPNCPSWNGQVSRRFTVANGETYVIDVNGSLF